MVSRRNLLGLGITAGAIGAVGGSLTLPQAFAAPPGHPAGRPGAAAPKIAPFSRPLTVPPVLSPILETSTTDYYAVVMRTARREILPGTRTDVLTYNGSFPGPTIKARSGRKVVVRQVNALRSETSVHLHGGEIPEDSDGSVTNTIRPWRTKRYTYPNDQPNATLWLHDHAHHLASEHVYRGLSSLYLIGDETEDALGLPSGDYDVPLILRDAEFDEDAQLVYTMDDGAGRTTIMVNGTPWPRMRVEGRKYRFRLVNSTNMRLFVLHLSDGSPFTLIGSDGGLLEKPFSTPILTNSPGERLDFVIDFAQYEPGTKLVLQNLIGPGPTERTGQVMRFDVGEPVDDPSAVPDTLRTLPAVKPATVRRSFELNMDEPGSGGHQAYINGRTFDPERIDTTIEWGTTEEWTVTNKSATIPHNFHTHLVQFRLLERNGKPVDPSEAGLKDTVLLFPGQSVKLRATFDTYRGVYPYHCHMLDHSAMGMMAQMEIV